MRQRLLQHLSFAKPLRLALILSTLLLAQTAWGQTVTTYTFTGTSAISNNTGTATSNVTGVGERTWTINNFTIFNSESVAQNIIPYKIDNTLGYSISGATSYTADFMLESDFGITGAFVSATISYTTNNMSSGEVQVYNANGNYPLTSGTGNANKITMNLAQSTVTLSLSNNYDKKYFNNNHISFQFTFKPSSADSYFQINSITITTTPVTFYGITVKGTSVRSDNVSNVLNDDFSSVSYNATTNTLTLKNVDLTYGDDKNINATSALTINLVGYNEVGEINVNDGNSVVDLKFTTSETLPGRLKFTNITGNNSILCENGLSWDNTNKYIKSSSTNPHIIYGFGSYTNGDINGYNNEGGMEELDVSPDVEFKYSTSNTDIKYFKVSSSEKSCYLYPASLDDMNLVTKAYLLFDWGTCTNKDVKVQVKGLKSDFTNDGTYSSEVSLPSDGGLVEIPLNGTINSYYFQLYFSSPTSEFSFIPISVGFQKAESYGISVAGTAVTSTNAANVFGSAGTATVSFTPATGSNTTNTLTLNGYQNVSSNAAIVSSLPNLTIVINGESELGSSSGWDGFIQSTNANAKLTFKKGSDNSTLILHASNSDAVVQGFASVSYGEAYFSYSSAINYNTTDKRYENRYGQLQLLTITTTPHYPIWVEAIQVSDTNKNNLANGKATFTPGTNTTPNILLLDNAYISSMTAIESGLDNLTISLIGDNTLSTNYTGYNPIYSVNPSATLTIKNAGDAICYLHMRTQQSNDAVIKGFASVSYDGLNFVSKTGTTLYNDATHDADISSSGIYPLWINDNVVTDENKASNATIVYDNGTNTLTLNGYTYTAVAADGPTIETNISGLKVKLKGASNSINCINNTSYAFYTYQPSTASIQFVRDDASSKLTIATTGEPFYGFANDKVTYDGLFYYSSSGNEKYITQAAAPVLSRLIKNDGNNNSYTYVTIDYAASDKSGNTVIYSAANPALKYSFDYADSQKQDVSDQAYPAEGIKMTDPGILTAWVEVGTYKGPEAKGVRFGILENPIEMEFNGQSKQIDFTPAPTMTNPVTVDASNTSTFATHDATNNKLTINNCFIGKVSVSFTNTDGGYTSLNGDSTLISFTIKPTAPTLSLESGAYYPNQELTVTPMITGTEYSTTLKINNLDQTSPYTFNTVGRYDARAVTSYSPSGSNVSYDGTLAEALYIINNQPVISAVYNDQSAYDGTKNGNVTYSISIALLQANCTLMYYYGTDKSTAAAYTNTVDTVLVESKTVNAFIRYTDGTTTYDTAPVTVSYTVKQDLGINFTADQSYRTYYLSDYSLNKPQGVKAYIITGISENSVKTTAIDYIPQGVAVLLEKDGAAPAGGYVADTYTGTAGNFAGNLLKYTGGNTTVTTTGKEFILYKNEFVKATGVIPANNCYLDLGGTNLPARGVLGIGNDGSTAIEGIDVEATEDETWYDLQGRRIQKPTKAGIYIVNGKKVIINNK